MMKKSGYLFSSFKKTAAVFSVAIIMFLVLSSVYGILGIAEKAESSNLNGATEQITADEFLASDASRFFKQEKYSDAISAIDSLLSKYPKDPLLLRYKAIALDRLGRSKEAIVIFEDLLLQDPTHAPTHYFLGQAYFRSGDAERASREWQGIMSLPEDSGPYRGWAASALEQIKSSVNPASVEPIMRWNVQGRYGYEYDSNVTLRPNDKNIATPTDQNAGRHLLEFATRYRAYSSRDVAVDLLYGVSQSLHDDSLNEFNFHSEEFGIHAKKRVELGNQDVVFGARYDFLLGILEDHIFSARNRWHLSADTQFSEKTRTIFYDRMTLSSFNDDGFDSPKTSRDGFYNDFGATNYWYFNNFQRHLFARQEFNSAHTHGRNFDSIGTTSRVGLHETINSRFDFDASTGLELGFYPWFSSVNRGDLSRRRDTNWDIYTALTYKLNNNLGLRAFYRFVNAMNQNNVFDYDRHIGGIQLVYAQDFK